MVRLVVGSVLVVIGSMLLVGLLNELGSRGADRSVGGAGIGAGFGLGLMIVGVLVARHKDPS